MLLQLNRIRSNRTTKSALIDFSQLGPSSTWRVTVATWQSSNGSVLLLQENCISSNYEHRSPLFARFREPLDSRPVSILLRWPSSRLPLDAPILYPTPRKIQPKQLLQSHMDSKSVQSDSIYEPSWSSRSKLFGDSKDSDLWRWTDRIFHKVGWL